MFLLGQKLYTYDKNTGQVFFFKRKWLSNIKRCFLHCFVSVKSFGSASNDFLEIYHSFSPGRMEVFRSQGWHTFDSVRS